MSYHEPYTPVEPPEIRHPQEKLTQHDFYVTFDSGRAELDALHLISEWMGKQPPSTLVAIVFSYHMENDDEPAMLEASLILGAPLDIG
jgi:hypothetical protein